MQNICVFEVEVVRYGTNEVLKKLHFLGFSLFQVAHIAGDTIFGEDGEFENQPVEIGSIKKVPGIFNIENPDFVLDMMDEEDNDGEFDGSQPLEFAKELPEEATLTFECECKEKLTVPSGIFPFVKCPNCENRILRREIVTVGGITFYQKSK